MGGGRAGGRARASDELEDEHARRVRRTLKTTLFRSCRRSWRKTRRDIGRRHGSTIPGSGVSAGSGLTLDATSASGSTPGSDVSLGSRLISGSAFAGRKSRGGSPTGRRPSLATVLAIFAPSRVRRSGSPPPCTGRTLPCSQMLEPHSLDAAASMLADVPPPHSLHWVRSSRARRSGSPRTPCTCFAPSRARKCSSPALLATAASRARRWPAPALLALASLPPVLADGGPRLSHWVRRLPCSQMLSPPLCTGFAPSRARRSESPHLRLLRTLRARSPAPALLALGSPPPVLADARAPPPCLLRTLPCSQILSPGTPYSGILGWPSRAGTSEHESLRLPRARSLARLFGMASCVRAERCGLALAEREI